MKSSVTIIMLIVVLALSNPSMDNYRGYLRQEIYQNIEDAEKNNIWFLLGLVGLDSIISLNTKRTDYTVFSLYETRIEEEYISFVGILNNFIRLDHVSGHSTLDSNSSLISNVDKYPGEFFDSNKQYANRIRRLLGDKYDLYERNSGVQVPIKLMRTGEGHFLAISGCRTDYCSDHSALTLINLTTDMIHVALFTRTDDQGNGVIHVYSEDTDNIPLSILNLYAADSQPQYWDAKNIQIILKK